MIGFTIGYAVTAGVSKFVFIELLILPPILIFFIDWQKGQYKKS